MGISYIALVFLMSSLGSFVRPDPTKNADLQHITISRAAPLSTFDFIKVRRNVITEDVGWTQRLFNGGLPDQYHWIPFDEFNISGDSIEIEVATTGNLTNRERYATLDVLYSLKKSEMAWEPGQQFKTVKTLDQQVVEVERKQLAATVREQAIAQKTFLLGTDQYGRDLLSRWIAGGIPSIIIGLFSVFLALLIGTTIGLVAGYFGTWVDTFLSWVINVFLSVPAILFVIAITLMLGAGLVAVMIGISSILWVEMAQIIRGEVRSISEKEYIKAARLMGQSHFGIIVYQILPNLWSLLVVLCVSNFAEAVLLESGLSFLGIGIQPPIPSWGNMIRESYGYIITDGAYLALVPGIGVVALVLSFYAIGTNVKTLLLKSEMRARNLQT